MPPVDSAGPTLPRRVRVIFDVEEQPGQFLLGKESAPETELHREAVELLRRSLEVWARRTRRDVLVGSGLPCCWDPSDARIGVAPDVVLIEPPPPEGAGADSLRLWQPGHHPPRVAIEVVSEATADRHYHDAPLRYGLIGAREVWVFDPLRLGPRDMGGAFVLQVWRRQGENTPMHRVYAGHGPARTDELGAWLVVTDEGRHLRLSDDVHGRHLWPAESGATAPGEPPAGPPRR